MIKVTIFKNEINYFHIHKCNQYFLDKGTFILVFWKWLVILSTASMGNIQVGTEYKNCVCSVIFYPFCGNVEMECLIMKNSLFNPELEQYFKSFTGTSLECLIICYCDCLYTWEVFNISANKVNWNHRKPLWNIKTTQFLLVYFSYMVSMHLCTNW